MYDRKKIVNKEYQKFDIGGWSLNFYEFFET